MAAIKTIRHTVLKVLKASETSLLIKEADYKEQFASFELILDSWLE